MSNGRTEGGLQSSPQKLAITIDYPTRAPKQTVANFTLSPFVAQGKEADGKPKRRSEHTHARGFFLRRRSLRSKGQQRQAHRTTHTRRLLCFLSVLPNRAHRHTGTSAPFAVCNFVHIFTCNGEHFSLLPIPQYQGSSNVDSTFHRTHTLSLSGFRSLGCDPLSAVRDVRLCGCCLESQPKQSHRRAAR